MRFWEILSEDTDRYSIEKEQISYIANDIEKFKGSDPYIELKIGNKTIKAASARRLKMGLKADMVIVDETGNPTSYVSLKGDQFQWGGYKQLVQDREVYEWINIFLEDAYEISGGKFVNGDSLKLEKPGLEIGKSIMYGKDYPADTTGPENVDFVIIGSPKIIKSNGSLNLIASKIYENGEDPSDNHVPILIARFTVGPSVPVNGKKILNCFLQAEPKSTTRNALPIDTKNQVDLAIKDFQARRRGDPNARKVKTRMAATKDNGPPYANFQDALKKLVSYIKKSSPFLLSNYNYKEKDAALQNIVSIMRKYNDTPQMAVNRWKGAEIYQEGKNVSSKRR